MKVKLFEKWRHRRNLFHDIKFNIPYCFDFKFILVSVYCFKDNLYFSCNEYEYIWILASYEIRYSDVSQSLIVSRKAFYLSEMRYYVRPTKTRFIK